MPKYTVLRAFKALAFSLCFSIFFLLSNIATADHNHASNKLKLVWVAHDASRSLAKIAKQYAEITGIEIEVIMLPYGSEWHSRIAAELNVNGSGFDLAVWDSQSVAEFAKQGHIELLNPYIENSNKLSLLDFDQKALQRYAEYPEDSGKMWAIPINQDTLGLVYRKDLFENPQERDNFKKKYGYPLSIPKTYNELQDIAEFFTRPDQGLYGWAQFAAQEYDLASSAANGFIWSYGGELWNSKTNEIVGFLDSPASIDGLEQYLKMFDFSPSEARDWGYLEINESFKQGHLAVISQWFVFFDELEQLNQSNKKHKIGFANMPGAIGRDSKFRQQTSLGGQGIGINRYSGMKKEAWAFIEWFIQDEQQWEYAKHGQTAKKSILQTARWETLNQQNKIFSVAMTRVNDYWHLPEYIKLLEVLQQEIVAAIQGRKTAKQALSMAAIRQERILREAGYTIQRSQFVPAVPNQTVNSISDPNKQESFR